MGFLAAGLVFTTSAVNSLVYSPDGAKEAAAAGHILLSMIAVRSSISTPMDKTDLDNRLSGSSTSGRPLKLLTVDTSTRLLSTKTNVNQCAIADPYQTHSVEDQRQP